MSELINSIKLIKMLAWEKPFMENILSLKETEMKELRKSGLLASLPLTLNPSTLTIAQFSIFLTMSLAGLEMNTAQVFTILSIFNALEFSMSSLSTAVMEISASRVAFKRFQEFLGI